jgi:tetratricopeptide (TPR) repeat protein
LSLNLKRWDDAREYYMKAIELNPDDAHNYFSMAVIDWTLAYPPRVKMRDDMHLNDSEMISDPAACVSLRTQNQHYVEDGMQSLEKALQIQPDDDDAMAYMNLLYRERAEYECDQPDARKADLKAADEWVDKAIAAKKAKAEKTTEPPH